jgi:hypothetical protein
VRRKRKTAAEVVVDDGGRGWRTKWEARGGALSSTHDRHSSLQWFSLASSCRTKPILEQAWTKLSDLDTKEITRCEHVLGNVVLGCGLWVGKTSTETLKVSTMLLPTSSSALFLLLPTEIG